MSDGFFNRPRRQLDPRSHDGGDRAGGGNQSRAPGQDATDRRDPGADALLELARLIGQTDSFPPAPGRTNDARKADANAPDGSRGAGSSDFGTQDPPERPPGRPSGRDAAQFRGRSFEEDEARERRPFEDFSGGTASGSRGKEFVRRDAPVAAPRIPLQKTRPEDDRSEASHSEHFDFAQLSGRDEYPVVPWQPQADSGGYQADDRHEDEPTPQRRPAYGKQHEYSDEYREDEFEQDGDYDYEAELDEDGDGEEGHKRRNSTKVVIAVLGLAVFGSAAAFGYRTIFKAPPSGPTPIIRADNSPTKITPATTDATAKPIGERLADTSGERLVRRDEEPVDVGSAYRTGAGGAVAPIPETSGSPPPDTVPASPGDTKRVRTVTIKADQGTASSDRTATAPPRVVQPSPTVSPVLPSPAPPSPAVPSPPQRQAAVSPPPSIAPFAVPPDAAAPPRAAESGGFVVQLSAQRSEAEAQTSFRTLQAKYSVLSSYQLLIRRKDQGERGVFYAAQVGPFGAKSEADQLCETLKSAGGSCFVQKN